MSNIQSEDLTCIFTGEFMVDPITLPQCGHTFSRSPLIEYKVIKECGWR